MRGEGRGRDLFIIYSGEGWKKESEAPGRKRQEVYGDKQVKKKMLIKHNEVKKKAVHVEPGDSTIDHQQTTDAKSEIPTVPKWQAEKWAKNNQH